MPRRGENIYKRKDGRWEGRYILSRDPLRGKTAYGYVYASSYQDVRRKKAAAEQGLHKPKKTALTVADCFHRWMEERQADPHARCSTLNRYRSLIDNHILPGLGDLRLQQLSTPMIEQFRLEKLRSGRLDGKGGLSPSVVQSLIFLIGTLQRACVDWGLITEVSAKNIKTRLPAHREVRVFSLEEQQILVDALLRSLELPLLPGYPLYLGIFFALYTGVRVGELCGLEWRDIDWPRQEVHIRRAVQRTAAPPGGAAKTMLHVGPPKSSGSLRALPLTPPLLYRLRQYYESLPACDRAAEHSIFSVRGVRLEPRRFQTFFHRLLDELGLGAGNFHALRHTFATRCIESLMDARTLSELLGHSSPSITMARYAHSFSQQKHACIARLDQHAPALLSVPPAGLLGETLRADSIFPQPAC